MVAAAIMPVHGNFGKKVWSCKISLNDFFSGLGKVCLYNNNKMEMF